MSITPEEVNKIANLASIKLSEEEKKIYGEEINKILMWIDQLKDINTQSFEPMISVVNHDNHFNKDEPKETKREDIINNAPLAKYGYYAAPKVIE